MFHQLDPFGSDQRHQTLGSVCDQNAAFCCLLAEPTSLGKMKQKNQKTIHLEKVSDQANVRLNPLLIIPSADRSDL